MSEAREYEVRGVYHVTVAKRVLARSEEEAMHIAEELLDDLETEWGGNSVFTNSEATVLEADGSLEWRGASTESYYTSEGDYDSDSEDYWDDYYVDDDDYEEEEE